MRPVFYSDVSTAARALLAMPENERAEGCRTLIEHAAIADRYAKHLGRIHPLWGNGTLAAAARTGPLEPERSLDDPAFSCCFELVLRTLRMRRTMRGM
jgi:hypothetical protein